MKSFDFVAVVSNIQNLNLKNLKNSTKFDEVQLYSYECICLWQKTEYLK